MLRKYYSMASMSNIMRLAAGLIMLFTVGVVHAATITYTYDSLNRLTSVTYSSGESITYTYDSTGNRLTLESTASSISPPVITTDDGIFITDDLTICWNGYPAAYGNMTIEYAVGSAQGLTDMLNWTVVPSGSNCITIPASSLIDDNEHYVSLRGKTFNGLLSGIAATDGVIYLNPIGDADSDGHTNRDEITAKSNPHDPDSIPGTTSIHLYLGFNLVSVPAEMLFMDSAFKMLPLLGDDQEIERVLHLNRANDKYEEASYLSGNILTGIDFPNKNGEAHIIYSKVEKVVTFTSKVCPEWNLSIRLNLVGSPCASSGLTAFQLLQDLGGETVVSSIQRYNPSTGRFDTAAYENGQPVGVDFEIVPGEGYFVYMKEGRSVFRP